MKTKTIKCRHNPNLLIDATIDVFTGRPLVTIYQEDCPLDEDITLTPVEAERLAKALLVAAAAARVKGQS